jgi:lysozyme
MDNINKINAEGLALIKAEEGLRLKAYLCPANVWTIGYGNTFYEDGTAVKKDDAITKDRAEKLFLLIVKRFENAVNGAVKVGLNANQFAALVSFTYNCGAPALAKSSLLRKVTANPNDPTITAAFGLWNKANGVVNKGLVKRRKTEAELYFKAV